MSYLIVIPRVQVENANAISGLTYGFPAISHFLGFTHALSRRVEQSHQLTFTGCGVVCHQQQVLAYRGSQWSDYSFALTRNPLTKEAKTASFNEEGRMHMTVTLFIECTGVIANGDEGARAFAAELQALYPTQRLAGGTIVSAQLPRILAIPEDDEKLLSFTRQEMYRALPGFALIDRSDYLAAHWQQRQQQDPDAEMLDAWLDFSLIKTRATANDENKPPQPGDAATWSLEAKPQPGYLVPLMTGYSAISAAYPAGAVDKTRDPTQPFCFVEAAYSVGEWRSPHRIKDIRQLLWHYQYQDCHYLCRQAEKIEETEEFDPAPYLD